jgi:hypothetical protein
MMLAKKYHPCQSELVKLLMNLQLMELMIFLSKIWSLFHNSFHPNLKINDLFFIFILNLKD